MRLSTDFECGGGKRLQAVGENHWRVEAAGDPSGYDKYFCVRVTADPGEAAAVLRLDVYPDADLGEAGARYFASHFPSHLWACQGEWRADNAQRAVWVTLRGLWEDAVTFRDRALELRVPVAPGASLYLASNPPRRYSDLLAWLGTLRATGDARVEVGSIGRSTEGRDIPFVRRRGARPGLPRFLVLAGQHPAEHSGVWASEGILEYALSPIAEARELFDHVDLAVIPMVNPDGNVRGLSGANAEGIDLCEEWATGGDSREPEPAPRATENRCLWQWLRAEFAPDALLDLHGGLGWRGLPDPPHDGAILFARPVERVARDAQRQAVLRALRARLLFETPGHQARDDSNAVLGERFLEYHLARTFGTLAVLYHVNAGTAGALAQFRRGPPIAAAIVRALVHDAGAGSGLDQ